MNIANNMEVIAVAVVAAIVLGASCRASPAGGQLHRHPGRAKRQGHHASGGGEGQAPEHR